MDQDKGIKNYFANKKQSLSVSGNLSDMNRRSKTGKDNFIQEENFQTRNEKIEFEEEKHFGDTKNVPTEGESKDIKAFFISSTNQSKTKSKKLPHFKKGSPGKPNQYSKLSEKDRENVYLDVYDENLQLKKKEENLTSQIKQLNTKLQVIETQFIAIKRGKDPSEDRVGGPSEQENLNKAVDLKTENQRLKEKLKALSLAKSIVKSKPSGKSKQIISTLAPKDDRFAESIKVIDHLKKRLKDSEGQLKAMQEAFSKSSHFVGGGMQSDVHTKNIKLASLQNRYDELLANMESQKLNYDNTKKRLEELTDQLYKQQEENNRLRKEMRGLELSVSHIKDVESKVKELEDEKKNLNMRLQDLCESPFIKQHEERANLQFQLRKNETELQNVTSENKILKDQLTKNEIELERTRKGLEETTAELKQKIELAAQLKANLEIKDQQLGPFKDLDRQDDAFLKALGMVKWQGEEPAWAKLDFLERPQQFQNLDMNMKPEMLLKEIERLRLEKGELAAQLEKSQTLLKIQMESEQEQNKIHQAQISTLELQLKGAILRSNELTKLVDLKGYGSQEGVEIYEKNGNKYDDRVSVFSDDTSTDIENEPGTNYFEVWLGDAELDESGIRSILKSNKDMIIDIKRVLTFMIVDFYNHDSQHSSIAEGCHTNFNFQMSFKVLCDEVFLQFLETGFLKLELYVSEGMDTPPIAKANIPLKDLIKKTLGEGIAPALSSSITFFGDKNQIIGLLNYRIRMKYPIAESLKWMKEKRVLGIIEEEVEKLDENIRRKRKLVIIIDKATGLRQNYNTFVAYTLNGKDYHTAPQHGEKPKWDHTGIHEIDYDEIFIGYLKSSVLEFVLIDDNIPLIAANNLAQELNDLIGFARLSISGLINNEIIDADITIYGSKKEKRGVLHVKVFWHEGALPRKPMPEDSLISKSWEQELILRIASALRAKQLNIESSFMIFDQDRDLIINYHDFQNTLLVTLNLQIHKDEVELFYQKLPMPMTRENFITVFGAHLPNAYQQPNKADISKLNVLLQNNTLQLNGNNILTDNTKKIIGQKLAERIRQTSQLAVFQDLDKNHDGFVSFLELKVYFLNLGLKFFDDELYTFMNGVDLDKNNKIDIKEFLSYVLSGFTLTGSSLDQVPEMLTTDRFKDNMDMMNASRSSISPTKRMDNLVAKMMDMILNYMKKNKLSYLKLFEKINTNKNNFLKQEELNAFLKKIDMDISMKDTGLLLGHLDENGDNQISIKEFVDKIKEFANYKQVDSLYDDEYKEISSETLNNKIVQYISQYLVSNKKSVSDFFNGIDKNDDGLISREELNTFFIKTLKLTLSRDELYSFFNYMDQNHDNKIQIPEFVKIMKPSVELAMKTPKGLITSALSSGRGTRTDLNMSTPYSPEFLNNVQNKLYEYVNKNQTMLKSDFQTNRSEKLGYVSPKSFQEILNENKEFSSKEINSIIENFCEKNSEGYINYDKFINNSKARPKKLNFSITNESSKDLLKSQNMAKEIFKKINKVLKEHKIDIKEAFDRFDMDGNGTIDVEEFKSAFKAMKLNYSEEDIEEIIKVIGVNGKEVNLNKFKQALNSN